MHNSQIRIDAKEKTKKYFDHLYFPTVVFGLLDPIVSIVPIFGKSFLAPFNLHIYDLCNHPEDYPRFTWGDFKKHFKSQWGVCLAYNARAALYAVLLPLLVALGCFLLMMILPVIAISSRSYDSLGFVGVMEALIILVLIADGIYALYRVYRTSLGMYIIYRNPAVTSQEALDASIALTKGNLLRFIGMSICLIPQYILTIFAGYGTPFVRMAFAMMFEDICSEGSEIKSELVCPHCGAPITAGSKFCASCGQDLSSK